MEKEKGTGHKKKSPLGCLAMVAIVGFIIIYASLSSLFKSDGDSAPALKPKQLIDAKSWAVIEVSIENSLKEGLIKKLDTANGKAWIEDSTWALVNAEVKETMTKGIATYCAVKNNSEFRSAEILGWRSGKKLASFSSLGGFKVH